MSAHCFSGRVVILGACLLFLVISGEAGADDPAALFAEPDVTAVQETAVFAAENVPEAGDSKLKRFFQNISLLPILKKGGPIMWPLMLASILTLGTVIERGVFLFTEQSRKDPGALKKMFEAVSAGNIFEAIRISNGSGYYVVRVLGYALTHREKSLETALIFAQEHELNNFRRGIALLDTIITLAPLLGLLGTVTGMMGSFSLIGGELSTPGAVTGGIAEALIATAFGLGIAITSLIPFNFLNSKLEEARLDIESAATQLELLIHPHSKKGLAGVQCVDS